MARAKRDEEEVSAAAIESPDDWDWTNVAEESAIRVVFDTIGDVFVGQYVGVDHVKAEKDGKDASFDLYVFRGQDGKLYALNQSFKLVQAMDQVSEGTWVRVTYVADVPTKQPQPMKDFRVDVRNG